MGAADLHILYSCRSERLRAIIRDEEAAGSNPVTPTTSFRSSRPLLGGAFAISGLLLRLDPQRIHNKRVLDPLHEVRRNVGADAQRRGHVLMPHDPLNDVRRHALGHEPRRVRVPQIVEPQPLGKARPCEALGFQIRVRKLVRPTGLPTELTNTSSGDENV
jgi:hypothetical protein